MDDDRLRLLYAMLGAALALESAVSLGLHVGAYAGWAMCVAAALAATRTVYLGFVGCARPRVTALFTALRAASGAIAVVCPVRAVTVGVGAATVLMIGSSLERRRNPSDGST